MATVEAFQIDGMKLWFYSGDHHPPHFHVKRAGKWELRVYFLQQRSKMFDVIWSDERIQKADQDRICQLVEANRDILLQEWERKVCHEN